MTGPLPPCDVAVAGEVNTQLDWLQQHPTWLYRSVLDGSLADAADGAVLHAATHLLGRIEVADGRLVAADPYWAEQLSAPFVEPVPAGAHDVHAAIATIEEDHLRTAAALLVTGPGPVVRWSLATTPNSAPATEFGEFAGYSVDTGTGAFLSPGALPALAEVLDEDAGMLEDPISLLLATGLECGVGRPRDGALAVAVFHSGWGDGVYPTWFGHAADGSAAVVMTDFLLTRDPWLPEADSDADGDDDEDEPDANDPPRSRPGLLGRLFGRG